MKSSLSFQVMLMTGMELYKEEGLIGSVMKECDWFAVKLSPHCQVFMSDGLLI